MAHLDLRKADGVYRMHTLEPPDGADWWLWGRSFFFGFPFPCYFFCICARVCVCVCCVSVCTPSRSVLPSLDKPTWPAKRPNNMPTYAQTTANGQIASFPSSAELDSVRLGVTGFPPFLTLWLGFVGFFCVLPSFKGFYSVLPSFS